MRPEPVRKVDAGARRLAKRTRRVQRDKAGFPVPIVRFFAGRAAVSRTQKPPETGGFRGIREAGLGQRPTSEPIGIVVLAAAVVAVTPIVVTAAVEIPVAMLKTLAPAAKPAPSHMGQEHQAPLLPLVERLVER